MIFIGADHRGFKLKEEIKKYLEVQKIPFKDMGAFELSPDDDYPDFALAVAKEVAENPEANRGILLCGTGIGVDIAANKIKGALSALVWNPEVAKTALSHNGANIISMPADYLNVSEAIEIVNAWLNAPVLKEERHQRRLKKIEEIEGVNQ